MTRAIHAFERDLAPALRLADQLGCALFPIACHRFPDGESKIRIDPAGLGDALLYASLDDPNAKMIELLLAADALHSPDGRRPTLIAPYLPYMRQDRAFHVGEAVSQKIMGRLLGEAFAALVTVEPHLHRTSSLGAVIPHSRAFSLSGAGPVADLLRSEGGGPALLVGPDDESANLTAPVAAALDWPFALLRKTRSGDRDVSVTKPSRLPEPGQRVILLDDVCSTGMTFAAAARSLAEAGAAEIEAVVLHALFDQPSEDLMIKAGIKRLRSFDSVPHRTNAGQLAPYLAQAILALQR